MLEIVNAFVTEDNIFVLDAVFDGDVKYYQIDLEDEPYELA